MMSVLVNREELAWAAGFFDGEGYIGVCWNGNGHLHSGKKFRSINLSIAQSIDKDGRTAYVLKRFQKVVLGLGHIAKKRDHQGNRRAANQFQSGKFEHIQAIIALLWKYLSPTKKQQAMLALNKYHNMR